MAPSQWWRTLRTSRYGDIPFIFLGVFIGWNCDISCIVKGVSMLPTLHPGEYVVFVPYTLLRLRQWLQLPLVKPDDVVIVKVSDDLSVCKRVTRSTTQRKEAETWGKDYYVEVVPAPYFPTAASSANDEVERGDATKEARDRKTAHTLQSEKDYYDYVTRKAVRAKDWDSCIDRIAQPSQWVWLEGDNKPESMDSRRCGPVPVECVRGLVLGAIWPSPHVLRPAPSKEQKP